MNVDVTFCLVVTVISIVGPLVRARRVIRDLNQQKGIQSAEFRFEQVDKAMRHVAPISVLGLVLGMSVVLLADAGMTTRALIYILVGAWVREMYDRVFD